MRALAGLGLALLLLMTTAGPALAWDGRSLVTGYVEPGYMADGTWTHPGAAACPPWVRFGTQIEIGGLGMFSCEDRFARWLVPQQRFDLWVATTSQAYALTGVYRWRFYWPELLMM